VQRITGLDVTERVPDRIVQMADELVNVDLPADDLIRRLKEGKIYKQEKVGQALNNFFTPDNLLQLRELALREVAGAVGERIEAMLSPERHLPPQTLALCISTHHESTKRSIRKVARLAGGFAAQWHVVFVRKQRESVSAIPLATQRHLLNNLKLATELGAKVHTLESEHVADTIYEFAKKQKVSMLILGKSQRSFYKRLFFGDLVSRLSALTRHDPIDLLLISHKDQ
jgi:two-component system sensor histidine kinase KdpD